MTEFLALVVRYASPIGWALVLLALAVLVVVVVVVLVSQLRARARAAASTAAGAGAAGTDSGKAAAATFPAKIAARTMAEEFARGMALLRRTAAGRHWRYATPMVLLMGEAGAGKGTLLDAVELDRPFGPTPAPGAPSECAWHFFDKGVALDLQGDLVVRPDGSGGDDVRWRQFTRLLQRHRPERALDGIVLTIPCTDLVGPDRPGPEALHAKGEALYRRLWDLQQEIGLRLPVYVVVTKSDIVPGFRGYWQQIAPERRREIFGWSNRNNLEAAYGGHLVDEAFAEIGVRLHRTYVENAAAQDDPADPDGMFLFPGEFQRMAEPLKLYLDRIFRATAYHEAFFMRGLYFIGDGSGAAPQASLRALVPSGLLDGPSAPIDAPRPRPLFATDLFGEKIFSERRLARAAATGLIARNRKVLAAQVCIAALGLVLFVGAWFSTGRLDAGLRMMTPALEVIVAAEAAGHREVSASRLAVEHAEDLLGHFARIESRSLHFAFLPSSWVGGLESRVIDHFGFGFDSIILDPMRAKLEERSTVILEDFDRRVTSTADSQEYAFVGAADYRRINEFVEAMEELHVNVTAFENLRTSEIAEVARLAEYLFGVQLSYNFAANSELYAAALHRVEIKPFDRTPHARQARTMLRRLDETVGRRMAPDGPIAGRVRTLAAAIDEVERVQARRGDTSAALARLMDALVAVRTMLDDPAFQWILLSSPEADPEFRTLAAEVSASPFFGPVAAEELRVAAADRIATLRSAILGVRARLTGPVVLADPADGRLRLEAGLHSLAGGLRPVFGHSFMEARPEVQPAATAGPGVSLVWSTDRLADALELYRDYELFLARDLRNVPTTFRPVVERLARQRLRSNLLTEIAAAQIREPRPGDLFDPAAEGVIQREIRDFRAAAPTLLALLSVMRQLGFDDAYALLRDLAGRQALQLLTVVDGIAEGEMPYAAIDGFRRWDGVEAPTSAGFRAQDDVVLAQYLDTMRGRLGYLTTEMATPLIDFLLRDELGGTWRALPVLTKWQRLAAELLRYQANSPLSTTAMLEHFIRFELDTINPDNCFEKLDGADQARSGDFFIERRNVLRTQLLEQCRWLAGSAVQSDYDRLVADFNATLAGRYPFAPFDAGADTPEVEPTEIAAFLVRFTAAEERLRRGLERGAEVDPAARTALGFVRQMAGVRDFLAPLLVPPTGDVPPGFEVEVDFRVNRAREAQGNQIIEWALDFGGQRFVRGRDPRVGRWSPGIPVSLSLRWAKDAPVGPVASGPAGGPVVENRTAGFAYGNRWSLLRTLQAHRAEPADFERLQDPQPHTLRFEVPTAAVEPDGTVSSGVSGLARVFVRLSLTSPSADGKERVRHVLPEFPHRAPEADLAVVF